jgi:hypothetical protein
VDVIMTIAKVANRRALISTYARGMDLAKYC